MNEDHDYCCEICLGREQNLIDAAVSVLQINAENSGRVDEDLVDLATGLLKSKLSMTKLPKVSLG